MKTCDASAHPLAACDDPVVGPTPAPPPLTRWQGFDAAACRVLARLGLLRAWYAVASSVLRRCPTLARLVHNLRTTVLVPSRTGAPDPLPCAGGVLLERGMCFGGAFHADDECARPQQTVTVRTARRRASRPRHVEITVRGWRMIRSERS